MRRAAVWALVTFGAVFGLFLVSHSTPPVNAETPPNQSVWDNYLHIEEVQEDREFYNGHPCEKRTIYSVYKYQGSKFFSEKELHCGVYTDYGFTDGVWYALNENQDRAHHLTGGFHRFYPNHITTTFLPAEWDNSQYLFSYYKENIFSKLPDVYIDPSYAGGEAELRMDLDKVRDYFEPYQIKFADNQLVNVYLSAVSENGRYIVFSLFNDAAIIVHDTENKTYRTVALEHINLNTPGTMAVSNDGSAVILAGDDVYSAATGQSGLVAKLYLTAGCEQVLSEDQFVSTIQYSDQGCRSIDLISRIKNVLGDAQYSNAGWAYFDPKDQYLQISFWVYGGNSGSGQKYIRVSPSDVPQKSGYLAMGDSFSSGEGDLQGGTWYEPGTDQHGNKSTFSGRNLCHVSRRSYAYLLAKRLGYLNGNEAIPTTPPSSGDFHSVACSGAVIHNIIGGSRDGEDQSEGNEEDFRNRDNQYIHLKSTPQREWLQGGVKQIKSVTGESFAGEEQRTFNPEVITIGIGGNDVGFGRKLVECVVGPAPTCGYAVPGSAAAGRLAREIASMKPRLVKTYSEIKREAGENARIYVHGYPVFVKSDGDGCAINVGLNTKERILFEQSIKYLNRVIEAATLEAGVFYVDVGDIEQGAELCSGAEPDKMAHNGITQGDDKTISLCKIKPLVAPPSSGISFFCLLDDSSLEFGIGNETYHPTPYGHQLYAQRLQEATNNFTKQMPPPQKTEIPLPNPLQFGWDAYNYVNDLNIGSFLPVIADNYWRLSVTNQTVDNSDQLATNQSITVSGFYLEPNSTVHLEVRSDPIHIGDYQVDAQGNFETTFNLPDNLPSGVHNIVVSGYTKFGEKVEKYYPIFVVHSKDDFDGDGVNNDVDSCPLITNSGIDQDQDGVDDVCDGQLKSESDNNDNDEGSTNTSNEEPNNTQTNQSGSNKAKNQLNSMASRDNSTNKSIPENTNNDAEDVTNDIDEDISESGQPTNSATTAKDTLQTSGKSKAIILMWMLVLIGCGLLLVLILRRINKQE